MSREELLCGDQPAAPRPLSAPHLHRSDTWMGRRTLCCNLRDAKANLEEIRKAVLDNRVGHALTLVSFMLSENGEALKMAKKMDTRLKFYKQDMEQFWTETSVGERDT